MPALVSRFPSAQRALTRAADLFGEAAALADALAEMDAGGVAPRLPLDRLAGLDEIRQRNLLRWFLARHGVQLERAHIELVRQQFLSAADDTNPLLRAGSQEVRRYRGALWLASHTTPPGTCSVLAGEAVSPPDWPGRLDWQLRPGGLPHSSALCLALRVRQGGEAIRVRQGGPRRSVKHLMQEAGIPPWLRARWPLLWSSDQLVGVAGIAVDVAFQAKCDAPSIVPVWRPRDWPDAPAWFTAGLAPEGSA
jgi:tRNA(Ile)-lysidine synthase